MRADAEAEAEAEQPQPQRAHRRALSTAVDVLCFLVVCLAYILKATALWLVPARWRSRKSLAGDVVLITGGGGGLGRLLALRLARLRAVVVLWDINTSGIEETVRLVRLEGGRAHGYACDIAAREDVYRAAAEVRRDVGPVTVLVNNAGVASGRAFLDTPDHMIQRTFEVNVLAHYWTTKAFLPDMIAGARGHVVTIASMAGYVGINKLVDYCGSKFAAVGFDEALRVELESMGVRGVRTTVVSPYFIQATGMFDSVRSFVPTLKGSDVADRTVRAIQDEELFVLMPGYLRLMLMFKWVFPWECVSLFLRGLVPDPAPQEAAARKSSPASPPCAADVAITRHRITSASERKP